jgi:hypothetical protein
MREAMALAEKEGVDVTLLSHEEENVRPSHLTPFAICSVFRCSVYCLAIATLAATLARPDCR